MGTLTDVSFIITYLISPENRLRTGKSISGLAYQDKGIFIDGAIIRGKTPCKHKGFIVVKWLRYLGNALNGNLGRTRNDWWLIIVYCYCKTAGSCHPAFIGDSVSYYGWTKGILSACIIS